LLQKLLSDIFPLPTKDEAYHIRREPILKLGNPSASDFSRFSNLRKASSLLKTPSWVISRLSMSQPNVRQQVETVSGQDRLSEPGWKGFYRVSGVLAILTGVMGFVLMIGGLSLYSSGYPGDPAAYLQLVSQHQAQAYRLWSLWDINDFLGIAPTAAAYLILRHYNRTLALVGSLTVGLYIFYDISVTELNSMTLVSLSQGYASAATDALRASYVAAATYGYAALPLQTVLSFGIGSVGWILWCVPMAKSAFGRALAILGVAVNIVGILGAAAPVVTSVFLGWCQILAPPLIGFWIILVGLKLYRHSSQFADLDRATPR
jgi:hypothetical protein